MRPTTFRAADTYEWEESYPDYDASLYTAKGKILGAGGVQSFTAAGSGTTYTFSPTVTSTLAKGQYVLTLWVELTADATKRYTQLDIPITLQANLAGASAATDTRSAAQITLDAIETSLAENAGESLAVMTANARSIGYKNLKDMLDARDRLKAEVAGEQSQSNNSMILLEPRFN